MSADESMADPYQYDSIDEPITQEDCWTVITSFFQEKDWYLNNLIHLMNLLKPVFKN